MGSRKRILRATITLTFLPIGFAFSGPLLAQSSLPPDSFAVGVAPAARHLTLEEAKERALSSSKLLHLASLNAESKAYAIKTAAKAQAAVCAGTLDYVPSIAGFGGYLNQTAMSYVQPNISYLGVMSTYTFVDWGKRRNTILERKTLASMATTQLQQTED